LKASNAAPPADVLYRIGRWPDPLAWPPPAGSAAEPSRFDDPRNAFRVLYLAERRLGCFVESVARFRVPVVVLKEAGASVIPRGRVPASWRKMRCVGRLRLLPEQSWLDLRTMETAEVLRVEFALRLHQLGLADLDVSGLRGPSRALTRAIGRWAYDAGYQGIAYKSRFHDALDCWAVFEGAAVERVGLSEPIRRDDADLRAAAAHFGLAV